MRLRPTISAKNELLGVYKQAMQEGIVIEKTDPARLYNLRCSGLPYCPTSALINFGQRGVFRSMDMRMSFYVGVGNAVHETMQTFLSQSGKFLADYSCKECKKKYPLSHKHECCGMATAYDEVTLDVGTTKYLRVQGHIDAIFKDKTGKYWILDLKTSSLKAAEEKAKNPPLGYKRQVRAYAYLLWKQYGIKVAGVMLLFIPRDNPQDPTVWEMPIKEDMGSLRDELLQDKKLHRRTMKATTLEEMMDLSKNKCGDTYCDACKKPNKELEQLFSRFIAKGKYPILKDPG